MSMHYPNKSAVDMVYLFASRVKQAQVSGTKYRKDDVMVLGSDDSNPVMGRIKDVHILADEQCVFTIQHLLVYFHLPTMPMKW